MNSYIIYTTNYYYYSTLDRLRMKSVVVEFDEIDGKPCSVYIRLPIYIGKLHH